MSDKPKEKKPDTPAKPAEGGDGHGEAKKKGGIGALLTKLPVLMSGVMVIEAGVLFGAFKVLGGGAKAVEGATLLEKPAEGADGDGELVKDPHAEAAGEGEHGAKPDPNAVKVYANLRYALPVIDFKAPNKVSGKMLLFDVAIEAQVKGTHYYHAVEQLKQRKALISDRIRTIIAQSDPEKLNGQSEPGLETLKRQVKYQLDEIVDPKGDGLIEEVLVPRCIPFRADF